MNYKCYGSKEMNDIAEKSLLIYQDRINKNNLEYEVIENGIIIPLNYIDNMKHGVFNEDGNISKFPLVSNSFMNSKGNIIHIENNIFIDTDIYKDLDLIDECVVFLGRGWGQAQYGETLFESIDRLWYLLDKDLKNIKVIYISKPSLDCITLLELFGIKKENILTAEKPIKYRKIIVPEKSSKEDWSLNIKYKEIINKIKENVEQSRYKKVYFSRNKLSQKRTLCNDPIDKTFKQNGYKIFYPEELTLYEKISILKSAEYFVGSAGTNQHHILFAEDGINAIIINRNNEELIFFGSPLLVNAKLTLISTNNNFLPPAVTAGPFLIGGTEYLFKFFDDNNFKYNKKDFMYEYNQIIDYIFTWSKVYKRAYINSKEYISGSVKEINKNELSDKLIDLQYNNIGDSTIPIKTFLFIGKTTKVGSFQMDNFFVVQIFGLNIIKIKLNHELNFKTRVMHFLVKFVPIPNLRQKLRSKFNLPTPPFWKEQEEIEFTNLYNKYKNEKDKY